MLERQLEMIHVRVLGVLYDNVLSVSLCLVMYFVVFVEWFLFLFVFFAVVLYPLLYQTSYLKFKEQNYEHKKAKFKYKYLRNQNELHANGFKAGY